MSQQNCVLDSGVCNVSIMKTLTHLHGNVLIDITLLFSMNNSISVGLGGKVNFLYQHLN